MPLVLKANEACLANLGLRVPLEELANQALKDQTVKLVLQAAMEILELAELEAHQDHKDLKALKDPKV